MFECTACGFTTKLDVMLVAHQAICMKLDGEKRDYRESLLAAFVHRDAIPQVLELARVATLKHRYSAL